MDIAKKYVKTISKRFQKLPVYLPGSCIRVGDILSFGSDKCGRPNKSFGEPIGGFGNIISDSDFGREISVIPGKNERFYSYVSKNEVELQVGENGHLSHLTEGEFKFSFLKEGATIIIAKNIKSLKIENLNQLRNKVIEHHEKLNWKNYYIVYELETAGSALISQSNSAEGELILSANLKEFLIQEENILGIDAGIEFQVKWSKDQSFIIPGGENKPIFMKLLKVKDKGNLAGIEKVQKNDIELVEFGIEEFEE